MRYILLKRYFTVLKHLWKGGINLLVYFILGYLVISFVIFDVNIFDLTIWELTPPLDVLLVLAVLTYLVILPCSARVLVKQPEDLDVKTLLPNEEGIDAELFVQDGSEVYPFNEFTPKFLKEETKVLLQATLDGVRQTKTYLLLPEDIIKVSGNSFHLAEVQAFKREVKEIRVFSEKSSYVDHLRLIYDTADSSGSINPKALRKLDDFLDMG